MLGWIWPFWNLEKLQWKSEVRGERKKGPKGPLLQENMLCISQKCVTSNKIFWTCDLWVANVDDTHLNQRSNPKSRILAMFCYFWPLYLYLHDNVHKQNIPFWTTTLSLTTEGRLLFSLSRCGEP